VPPLSDTDITAWKDDYLSSDSNSPADSDYIAGMLGDQARNVKSVVRAESENKAWMRLGEVATYISATSFSLVGDQRAVASIGRRVKAAITGATRYGTITGSSFGSSITTITVQWDLEHYSTWTHTVSGDDSIVFVGSGDIRSRFAVDTTHEFWRLNSVTRKVRKVSALGFGGGATSVTYDNDDFYMPLDADDEDLLVPSQGIDNTLGEVQLGILTPDQFQSGLAHAVMAGSFSIQLNGTNGSVTPWTIPFPVRMPNTLFRVAVTPTGIQSGMPTATDWAKPYVSGVSATGFTVRFQTGATPDSATVLYDYVAWRQ